MSASMFTRRHYCAVAGLIRDAGYLDAEARGRLVSDFSTLFGRDNERFKPDRFRAAAYNGVKLSEPEPVPEPQSLRAELSERDRLEARGYKDGYAAATWFAPQDEESARRILRGLDEGDPEVLD